MRRWIAVILLVASLTAVALLAGLWVWSQTGWVSLRWRARAGDVFQLWVAEVREGSVGIAWYRLTAEASVHEGTDYSGVFSSHETEAIVRWRAEPGKLVHVWFEDDSPAWMVDWSRERRARWPTSWEMGTFGHEHRSIVRGLPKAAATFRLETRRVLAPLWALLLAAAACPTVWAGRLVARRARRRRRRRGGLCVECGYDLRGSSGGARQCPECGTASELDGGTAITRG